jgi:hypothetical protein
MCSHLRAGTAGHGPLGRARCRGRHGMPLRPACAEARLTRCRPLRGRRH